MFKEVSVFVFFPKRLKYRGEKFVCRPIFFLHINLQFTSRNFLVIVHSSQASLKFNISLPYNCIALSYIR